MKHGKSKQISNKFNIPFINLICALQKIVYPQEMALFSSTLINVQKKKNQKKPISGYLTFLFIYSLYSIERKFEHQTNFFQHLYFRCELEILFWAWGEFFFLTIGHREALQSC